MLVIDKEAHEVSMKEAGIWTAVWITLALIFSVFLWFYGDMVHGIETYDQLVAVCTKYAGDIVPKLNPNDFEGGLALYREEMTIAYITGYLIEKTLSVDNLFVMMMIFTSMNVSKKEYQHVLNWGILGAIVMRFIFIFIGAAIIARFKWVLIFFGLFLVYSGVKMFLERNKKEEEADAANHPLVKVVYDIYHQQVMEGNIIPNIIHNLDCIAHLHSAGHPGRNELQYGENDYHVIFSAVDKAGYTGCCGLEYNPLLEPEESLKEFRRIYLPA
jgi:TerC family integral membrane protein